MLILLEGQTGGSARLAGSISGGAEPFYGTMVGPWWYHTATSVPWVRNRPFSLLRMLILPGCFGNEATPTTLSMPLLPSTVRWLARPPAGKRPSVIGLQSRPGAAAGGT